jgi:hypothetical protein
MYQSIAFKISVNDTSIRLHRPIHFFNQEFNHVSH